MIVAAEAWHFLSSPVNWNEDSITRYIVPMKEYFVQAANAENLEMDNNTQVQNDAGNWFKYTGITRNMFNVIVKLETENSTDEINILVGSYTNQPGADGNYKLTFNCDPAEFEIVKFDDYQTLYLQNMNEQDVIGITALKTDDDNRFLLHVGPVNNEVYSELPVKIYSDGKQLIIDLALIDLETKVNICASPGLILLQKSLKGFIQHRLKINIKSQVLIVYLKNKQYKIFRKLSYENYEQLLRNNE